MLTSVQPSTQPMSESTYYLCAYDLLVCHYARGYVSIR